MIEEIQNPKKKTQNLSAYVLRLVRLFVVVFLPWIAVWQARKALYMSALILKNEAGTAPKFNKTLDRWADECLHDGWVIYKPYFDEDLPV